MLATLVSVMRPGCINQENSNNGDIMRCGVRAAILDATSEEEEEALRWKPLNNNAPSERDG